MGLHPSLGCEMLVGLRWDARSLRGAQGTSPNTGVDLEGLVQSWTNVGLPTQSSRIPLAPPAWLPAGSSLQEVAAHWELSERGALRLSICFQSLLQEKTPGKGNGAMEKLAELLLVRVVLWVRDPLGC